VIKAYIKEFEFEFILSNTQSQQLIGWWGWLIPHQPKGSSLSTSWFGGFNKV